MSKFADEPLEQAACDEMESAAAIADREPVERTSPRERDREPANSSSPRVHGQRHGRC
jgi:hypothetical protein